VRRERARERRDELATEAQCVELVVGEVVGDARDGAVHLGATERLGVGDLAGGHANERRTAEEDLSTLLDHDDVIAHARRVGAARGARAKHHSDLRHMSARGARHIIKRTTTSMKHFELLRQIRTARLNQHQCGQPILGRNGGGTRTAHKGGFVGRAAFDSVLVRHNVTHDATHHANHVHAVATNRTTVLAPAGQRTDFQHWRIVVQKQSDAFTWHQFATPPMSRLRARRAIAPRLEHSRRQFRHKRFH
jgi:hypothetical protein